VLGRSDGTTMHLCTHVVQKVRRHNNTTSHQHNPTSQQPNITPTQPHNNTTT
jgi:hypothetical protein